MPRNALIGIAVIAALAASPALSDDRTDSIVRQLRDQGYNSIKVSRTFLGRTRIVATVGDAQREIIVNPRTGEILRDYSQLGENAGHILQSAGINTSVEDNASSASTAGDGGSDDGGDNGDGGSDGDGGGDGDGSDGGGDGDGGDGGGDGDGGDGGGDGDGGDGD